MVTLTGVLEAHLATPAHGLPLRDLRDARRRQAEQRQRRGMRRLAGTGLRRLVQLGVRAARRQARRAAPRRDGRTLRLQPRPGDRRRRRRARCRRPTQIQGELASARPRSARARCWRAPLQMAIVAATIADGGRRPRRRFVAGAPARRRPRDERRGRAHRAPPDDRGRAQRHRHLGGDPRRRRRRQDRHRRTEDSCSAAPERTRSRRSRRSGIRRRRLRGRRERTRATPTPGSPRSRPRSTRGSSSCVLLVKDGAGGDTAAPVAREVLEAGLRRLGRARAGAGSR